MIRNKAKISYTTLYLQVYFHAIGISPASVCLSLTAHFPAQYRFNLKSLRDSWYGDTE